MAPPIEHIVLTTVVPHDEWRTDAAGVRAACRHRLRDRAAGRGLALVGEPVEDLQTTAFAERVRLTLTADAEPVSSTPTAPPAPPDLSPSAAAP